MDITTVIPIRKGSQRVPGKNMKPFAVGTDGQMKNLLNWKIEQLLSVFQPNQILVSSDWEDALSMAKSYGCEAHKREDWLAAADAPFDKVLESIANVVKTEHMMWTPATSPFIGPTTLHRFKSEYHNLSIQDRQRGLIALANHRSYVFLDGKPLNFEIEQGHQQTQDILPIGVFDWAISARTTEFVRQFSYMFSNAPITMELSPLENFDINDDIDFLMAQALTSAYFKVASSSE
jgi:CMP-N-acetylneuraminic acid synthetase